MIVEFRTYTLQPGSVATVEERFGQALQRRRKLSPLAAFWHTEVSPLNRVIDVRAYDSFEDRTRIRAASQKLEGHIGRSRSHRPLYYRRSPELGPVQRRAVNPGQEMADGDDRPSACPGYPRCHHRRREP